VKWVDMRISFWSVCRVVLTFGVPCRGGRRPAPVRGRTGRSALGRRESGGRGAREATRRRWRSDADRRPRTRSCAGGRRARPSVSSASPGASATSAREAELRCDAADRRIAALAAGGFGAIGTWLLASAASGTRRPPPAGRSPPTGRSCGRWRSGRRAAEALPAPASPGGALAPERGGVAVLRLAARPAGRLRGPATARARRSAVLSPASGPARRRSCRGGSWRASRGRVRDRR
jgi:hypothetical protein